MNPEEKARGWVTELAAKLRADLAAAEQQVTLAKSELEALGTTPGLPSMALVSVCLDRAYTAIEAGFLRIARSVDGTVPSGEGWHKALLHQMTLPLMDRRPAVIGAATAIQLDLLRAHRHWMRHAYAASFEWGRMAPAAATLAPAVAAARADLEQFAAFLETDE